MLLDHGVQEEYDMFTSDVSGAYLHADINEVVVLRLPRSCATIWLKYQENFRGYRIYCSNP